MKWIMPLALMLLSFSCSVQPYRASDVDRPRAQLPQDEQVHHMNSLEWWYFTGHLYNADSSLEFGTEFVIFHTTPRGKKDFLILNFALSDPQQDTFYYHYEFDRKQERLDSSQPLNLAVVGDEDTLALLRGLLGNYAWQARSASGDLALKIKTTPGKGLLLHDGVGYEDYGGLARAGYYSYPRLEAEGELSLMGEKIPVQGELWYDRQWNCLSVYETKVGWDWFSVQFEEPRSELMLYQLNHPKKDSVILKGGSYFTEEGSQIELASEDITLSPLEFWESPETGSRYPLRWRAQIPRLELDLEIEAEIAQQELEMRYLKVVRINYWEGMCTARGTLAGDSIRGNSYVEMTNR